MSQASIERHRTGIDDAGRVMGNTHWVLLFRCAELRHKAIFKRSSLLRQKPVCAHMEALFKEQRSPLSLSKTVIFVDFGHLNGLYTHDFKHLIFQIRIIISLPSTFNFINTSSQVYGTAGALFTVVPRSARHY